MSIATHGEGLRVKRWYHWLKFFARLVAIVFSTVAMKVVLVSYLERNKVLKIPEGENDELSYLKTQFFQVFGVENETVSVLFQYYSSEWEEYVELEAFDVI